MRRIIRRYVPVAAALLLAAAGTGTAGLDEIPTGTVVIAGRAHPAHIADEPAERAQGFQNVPRSRLRGALIYFRFPGPSLPVFHMHNVRAPLVIAWIGPDERVIGLTRMAPGRGGYRPPAPVSAALELHPSRVTPLGVAVGVTVRPAAH